MKYSLTFLGVIAMVLSKSMEYAGVVISTEEITSALTTFVTIMGGLLILAERIKKGGVNIFGFKK